MLSVEVADDTLYLAAALQATFEGTPLLSSQGLVTVPAEVPDGAEIH